MYNILEESAIVNVEMFTVGWPESHIFDRTGQITLPKHNFFDALFTYPEDYHANPLGT